MAKNWVPSIFHSGSHTASISWSIIANITMCSPILHIMVALYRRIQISFPLLVHCGWWPKRAGWFHFVPQLLHCVLPWCLRRLWWLSLGGFKCEIIVLECAFCGPGKWIFPFPGLRAFWVKRRAKALFTKDYARKRIYDLLKFNFSSDLRYF